MAGYDPKQKRAHSPTADEGPAPVDELLGAGPAPSHPAPAPHPGPAPGPAPAPGATPGPAPLSPPAPARPDPRAVAALVAAVVALVWFWRHRRS